MDKWIIIIYDSVDNNRFTSTDWNKIMIFHQRWITVRCDLDFYVWVKVIINSNGQVFF